MTGSSDESVSSDSSSSLKTRVTRRRAKEVAAVDGLAEILADDPSKKKAAVSPNTYNRTHVDFSDDSDDCNIYTGSPGKKKARRLFAETESDKKKAAVPLEEEERRGIPSPSPSPTTVPAVAAAHAPTNITRRNRILPTSAEVAAAEAAAAAQLKSPPPGAATPGVPAGDTVGPARRATRKSPQGTTTARKPKKKKAATVIRVGGRVFTTRKKVFLTVLDEEQKQCIRDYSDHYRLFGTVKSGKGKDGYNVEFDIFPAGHKVVKGLTRKRLTTLPKNAEEIQRPQSDWDKYNEMDEEARNDYRKHKGKKKKEDPYKACIDRFMSYEDDILREAKTFEMFYGETLNECIVWDIHGDTQYLPEENNNLKPPETLAMKKEIDFTKHTFDDIFFEHFFPSIKGHAKLMDEFLSDPRSPYYATAKEEKIKFHQPDDHDPDWVVRQCYLLMIASVTESDIGVNNLWRRGDSGGRRPYADFGQYMPKNYFKAFQSAAALMWCDKKWWFVDKRDRDWAIFEPCLENFNEKRRDLFYVTLLMLDESMSGWRPKTSVTGGMPNLTSEPRKPVNLGTQLRNGVECLSGVLVFQDSVAGSEVHRLKDFYYEDRHNLKRARSALPGKPEIHAHVAEVLRQANGAAVVRDGWVGGDAWFGSVMSSVELKLQLGLNSTFVMKLHTKFFPMGPLYAVLVARHGDRPAGHWVTMQAVISGVKLCAIAYAWSQKGVQYFITTCGSTEPSPILYESKFEDEWGRTGFREIERPKILHFLYEYLPLIDEHNKQRQGLLALEKRWQTRNGWYRLVTTLLGMSIVDMHRYYRYHELKMSGDDTVAAPEEEQILKVLKFTDTICGNMRQWKYKARRNQQTKVELQRIQCKDGSGRVNRNPSPSQLRSGKSVGNAYTLTCYICRRYRDDHGDQRKQTTQWWCKACRMPLCNECRAGEDGGREMSCVDEHLTSEHAALACNTVMHRGAAVPEDLIVSLHPRRNKKRKTTSP